MRSNHRPPIRGRCLPRPVVRLLRFELRAILVTVLASAIILGVYPATTPTARGAEPRVVIVVGPVGSLTDAYRADGDRAARAARAAGATVETIYSPDATWPRVRDALQGASLVVYLGHGNGWPSRYRKSAWPKTQNGLGLNPQAGVDDSAHQYFGEAYLARDVRLAPHAVVLLVHLCYASGNAEPGLPEGDLATGQQRVDNYAAGWLAAGAEAVLAEGHGGPAYYVRSILAGHGTIESIWRKAPTAHDHVLAFPSARTPGMTALMDPTRPTSGFYRSLVTRAQLRADEVARGAGQVRPRGGSAMAPLPASAAPVITAVTLDGMPTAGASLRLDLKLDKAGPKPERGLGIGVRWDPLAIDEPPVIPEAPGVAPATAPVGASAAPASPAAATEGTPEAPASPAAATEGTPKAAPATAASASAPKATPAAPRKAAPAAAPSSAPKATPASATAAATTAGPAEAAPAAVAPTEAEPAAASASPALDTGALAAAPPMVLISPEIPGAVVSLSDVTIKKAAISADVATPTEPGLYRLTVSLHDADGIAFDAATQDRLPAFTVRVTGALSAAISATDRLRAETGAAIDLPISVANTGRLAWVPDEPWRPERGSTSQPVPGDWYAALVGRWMRLGGSDATPEAGAARTTVQAQPGASDQVRLALTAPPEPGSYLLVLDVVSPLYGSLTAVGGAPTVVRVQVVAPGSAGAPDPGRPQPQGGLPPSLE